MECEGGRDVREALDQLELIGDLATLLRHLLLRAARPTRDLCQQQTLARLDGSYTGNDIGSGKGGAGIRFELIGARALLERHLYRAARG